MTHTTAPHSLRMPSLRGTTSAGLPFSTLVRARLRRPAHMSATVARGTWVFTRTAVRVTLLGRHAVP
ncbi:hypothetical protein GT354_22190 [Streptomyces sp. SID3343]|nr:hypothetical protein [Streptomyces sp. SID3343]